MKTNNKDDFIDNFNKSNKSKQAYNSKAKKKELNFDEEELEDYNNKKQKAKNRRANKYKDKNNYDKYDKWN